MNERTTGTRTVAPLAKLTGARLLTQSFLLAGLLIIPRIMGPDDYGVYIAIISLVMLMRPMADLGFTLVELTRLAPLNLPESRERFSAIGSSIWTAKLGLSVGVAILATGIFFLIRPAAFQWPGIAGFFLYALTLYISEGTITLIHAAGRPGSSGLTESLRAFLAIPLVIFGFHLAGVGGVVWALFITYLVVAGIASFILLASSPFRIPDANLRLLVPYRGEVILGGLGTIASQFYILFAVVVVGAWMGTREAAFLGLAIQLFSTLNALLAATRRAMMASISELRAEGNEPAVHKVVQRFVCGTTVFCTLITLQWVLLGRDFIGMVLKDEFLPAFPYVTWVLVAFTVYSTAMAVNTVLFAMERTATAVGILAGVASVVVIGVLVPVGVGRDLSAEWIGGVYVAASCGFLLVGYLKLGTLTSIRLSVWRPLLMATPLLSIGWLTRLPTASEIVILPALVIGGLYVMFAGWMGDLGWKDLILVHRAGEKA